MNSAAQRAWHQGTDGRTDRLHVLRGQRKGVAVRLDGEGAFLVAILLSDLPAGTFRDLYIQSAKDQILKALMSRITQEQRQAIAEWIVESEHYQSYRSIKKQ